MKCSPVIAFALALCLLVSVPAGCGDTELRQRITDAAAGARISAENESAAEAALLSRSVSFSPERRTTAENAADALAVTYPYSDLSGVEDAYERRRALPEEDRSAAEHGVASVFPLTPENRLFGQSYPTESPAGRRAARNAEA
jgi:hypothetical protein